MSTTPYQFIRRGQLFIVPVGPSIAEVPYPVQSFTKPRDYSLWVHGRIEEPAFQLDHARMPPSLYQDVRNDLVRYSPVEVTRSAFQRSNHAYVGVIDSKGQPYYFALDSRGMSVRAVEIDDDRVWKTFDKLAVQEHMQAVRARRHDATAEMKNVDRELSEPKLVVMMKGDYAAEMRRIGAELAEQCEEEDLDPPRPEDDAEKAAKWTPQNQFNYKPARSSWWRNMPKDKQPKQAKQPKEKTAKQPREKKLRATPEQRTQAHLEQYEARARGRQAVRDKLRGERKKTKQAKPKASNDRLDAWRKKHPGGNVDAVAAHPFAKALPKGGSKEKAVKKTPSKKASSKKVGAGGKPRYSYPGEKKKAGAKKPGAGGAKQQPLLVIAAKHDDSKHADPAELANQLGVSIRTLQHTARQHGRSGFGKFMRSHLKRFAAKHRLDPDFWNTLYERLHDMEPPTPA